MTSLTDQHTTTAMRCLLDHIDTHGLPAPQEFHMPGNLGDENRTSLLVIVPPADLDVWLASLVVESETSVERRNSRHPYVKSLFQTRLPDTGVQVTVYCLRPVQPVLTVIPVSS